MREGDVSESDLVVYDVVEFFFIKTIRSADDEGDSVFVLDDLGHVWRVALFAVLG